MVVYERFQGQWLGKLHFTFNSDYCIIILYKYYIIVGNLENNEKNTKMKFVKFLQSYLVVSDKARDAAAVLVSK